MTRQEEPVKIFNIIFLITVSSFIFSCSHQNPMSSTNSSLRGTQTTDSQSSQNSVVWEPEPRFVAKGNDGQLGIRASESMSLLYAAHDEKGKQDLYYTSSRNIGDRFSKPYRVNSEAGEVSAHGETSPKLKRGKGRGLFSAWVGNRDIKFARSMNFGKSFSPAIKVNDDEGKASQSFFTMDVAPDGAIYIIWLDGRDKKTNTSGTSSLYIARSTDNGASFEKNVKIAGDICPCCRPAIAFGDAGEIFVTWRHVYAENERVIAVASSLDKGETWSVPQRVTATGWKLNGCAHAGPALTYVNGTLVIAWYTGVEGRASLKMARSTDNGKTFKDVQEIQRRVVDANHPDILNFGDEAWVIFQGRDPEEKGGWGPDRAWLVRIGADGAATQPELLPSAGGGVSYPQLFMGNAGRVYATWTEFKEGEPNVVLCRGRLVKS
jgi:hypothetical protein